jgi:hypothetical protein
VDPRRPDRLGTQGRSRPAAPLSVKEACLEEGPEDQGRRLDREVPAGRPEVNPPEDLRQTALPCFTDRPPHSATGS